MEGISGDLKSDTGVHQNFSKILNVINAMGFRQTLCIFLMAKEKFKNIQKAFMVFDFLHIPSNSHHPRDLLPSDRGPRFEESGDRPRISLRANKKNSTFIVPVIFSKTFLGGDLPGKY